MQWLWCPKAYINVHTRLVQSLTLNSCRKMSRLYIRCCVSPIGSLHYNSTFNLCEMCYIKTWKHTWVQGRYRWGTGEVSSSQPSCTVNSYLEFLVSYRSLCVINKVWLISSPGIAVTDIAFQIQFHTCKKTIGFICSTRLVPGSTILWIPS